MQDCVHCEFRKFNFLKSYLKCVLKTGSLTSFFINLLEGLSDRFVLCRCTALGCELPLSLKCGARAFAALNPLRVPFSFSSRPPSGWCLGRFKPDAIRR